MNSFDAIEEHVENCTKQTTMARTAITTLSSKQNTLDATSKQLKGADLTKVKGAIEKIETELENAKNQLSVAESTCTSLKEEITKVTSVVVQYTQEFKYYEQILVTVKKEIEETEKNVVKVEEEKEEEVTFQSCPEFPRTHNALIHQQTSPIKNHRHQVTENVGHLSPSSPPIPCFWLPFAATALGGDPESGYLPSRPRPCGGPRA